MGGLVPGSRVTSHPTSRASGRRRAGSGPSEPSRPSSSLRVLSVFAAAQAESWIIDQGTLSFDWFQVLHHLKGTCLPAGGVAGAIHPSRRNQRSCATSPPALWLWDPQADPQRHD